MARFAAFLRGMNLGRRRLANAELRAAVEALGGFAEVAVVRASGNVVFAVEDDAAAPAAVAARLERGLEAQLGYPVPVFLREAGRVRAIAAHAPFAAEQLAASEGKVQVLLLSAAPSAEVRAATLAHATDADRLAIHGSELYWLPSGGISRSPLDAAAAFGPLGHGTMRTQATIALIAAKHFGA